MTVWRRWVFEAQAPLDEFARAYRVALESRGLEVADARRFDLVASGLGCRAFVKFAWADAGIEATIKVRSSLFSSVPGMERALLDAGREAQSRVAPPMGAR